MLMSKKSREKQKEISSKQKGISRRKAIKVMFATAGLFAVSAGVSTLYENIHAPSFTEAFDNPFKRDRWLSNLESRPYANKKIATSEDLLELKRNLDYTPPKDAFAAAIAEQEEIVGRGSKSTLYIYETCFNNDFTPFKKGLGIIVENVINNHELIHADHYFSGIPGYSINLFKKTDGSFNIPLFMSISEIIAHRNEYEKLVESKHKDEFVLFYQSKIKDLAYPHFQIIYHLTKDSEILKKVEREKWF